MNIALIAHDKKKDTMISFVKEHEAWFKTHDLFGTGTTGTRIMEHTSLKVVLKKSGPLGGDQEIGSMIANGNLDLVIFLRDPLSSQPHEPDVTALIRLCDVYMIPLATNISTARALVHSTQVYEK